MSAARIRALNDAFRRSFSGGRVLLTAGVSSYPAEHLAQVLAAVRNFEAFTRDNDPHGEHDFGAFEVEGVRHFWKIDYYDLAGVYASPDAADPAITLRVMTVMQADEY